MLTESLSIQHPIVLAAMGGCAGGALAAAVSNGGGLGLVGGARAETGSNESWRWSPSRPPNRLIGPCRWLRSLILSAASRWTCGSCPSPR
jgi:hypothetical protein